MKDERATLKREVILIQTVLWTQRILWDTTVSLRSHLKSVSERSGFLNKNITESAIRINRRVHPGFQRCNKNRHGEEGWRASVCGSRASVHKMKRVLEMDGGDGCISWVHLVSLNYTLKMVNIGHFILHVFYHILKIEEKVYSNLTIFGKSFGNIY